MVKMDDALLYVGGYSDDIFLNLSKRERIEFACYICRYVLNKPQQCSNGHLFCLSCITEWNKRGNNTCPICQLQPIYKENYDLKCKIDSKYVRCEASLCSWKGRLERLTRHFQDSHNSSARSSFSTERDMLSSNVRVEIHKTTMEVDRIHQQKKLVLIRRIKRIEKNKRHDALERDNAQTLPIESTLSRTDLHRPLTDGFERDSPYKLPHIQWRQPPVHKNSIYHRLEHVKQEEKELTNRKLQQVERRKQIERDNLYKKIRDIEMKREENRHLYDERILQIERRMRHNSNAFQQRISDKEKRHKKEYETLQRRICVVKVKMKR